MTEQAAPMALTRRRTASERVIEPLLFLAAALSVVTTAGIILVLAYQTFEFFLEVSPIEFFTGTFWSASIKPQAWGVLALVSGTLLVAGIAMIVAVPLGLLAAVLLAEYASPRVRNVVKPLLETIAGIPTIVLGFFAINFLAPRILQPIFGVGTFSALSAGLVVGSADHAAHRVDLGGRDAGRAARHARGRVCDGRHPLRDRAQGGRAGRAVRDHGRDHPGD